MGTRADFPNFASDFSTGSSAPFFVLGTDTSSEVLVVSESDVRDHILRKGMLHANLPDGELLPKEFRDSWAKYALGSLVSFYESTKGKVHLPENAVVAVSIVSTLPLGAGLSSSAALCTGLISAFCFAFGKHLSAQKIARLAMGVEHRFAGTKCGLMDQLAVMSSEASHFTSINFIDFPVAQSVHVENVQAHKNFEHYTAVAFHTGVSHSLASTEYNLRRAQCERALGLLNAHTKLSCASLAAYAEPVLFKKTFQMARENALQSHFVSHLTDLFVTGAGSKPEAEILAKRAAHAILENARVDDAMHALSHGDVEKLDTRLEESHRSLNEDYEVSCKELNMACEIARDTAHVLAKAIHLAEKPILGPRMTGGGFGGSTVQLVHNAILEKFVDTFRDAFNPYTRKTGNLPKLIVSRPQNGLRIRIV
jgi:galactokinase